MRVCMAFLSEWHCSYLRLMRPFLVTLTFDLFYLRTNSRVTRNIGKLSVNLGQTEHRQIDELMQCNV